MMSTLKKLLCLFALFTFFNVPSVFAQNAGASAGEEIIKLVLGDRTPKEFVPFTDSEIRELANKDPNDDLELDVQSGKTYLLLHVTSETQPERIEINEYIGLANQLEAQITPYGYSMRDESFEQLPVDIYELFNDPELLQKRLLDALELYARKELMRRLDAIDPGSCPQINVDRLVEKVNGHIADHADEKLKEFLDEPYRLKSGDLAKFDQYIRAANNTNKILCALGYSVYEAMNLPMKTVNGVTEVDVDRLIQMVGGGSGGNTAQAVISYIEDKINSALAGMGFDLPAIDSILTWSPLVKAMEWGSEFLELDGLKIKLTMPSPEFIKQTIEDLGLAIPANWDIPDVPTISFNESFEPPTREDLVLKKRKDWTGFDLGKRSIAGTKASAYYEIRGSEEVQWAIAVGRADVYIFNKENNAIGAYAQAEVGPQKLEGNVDIQVLGHQLYKRHWLKNEGIIKDSIELLGGGDGYSYSYDYTQQFAIGPIPVYVSVGVYASSNARLSWGLYMTQVYAELQPMAKAGAFGEGAVGIKKVLSAGVRGNIDVLNLSAPLRGKAGVFFAQSGEPYLKLGLTSDVLLRAMSGGISAYVEYPWIKICKKKIGFIKIPYPCIRSKRKSKNLYSYSGYAWSKPIMNWQLVYGYHGVQMNGSLIDQTDRREADALKGKVNLYQRHVALNDYSSKTQVRIQNTFAKLKEELESASVTLLPQKRAEFQLSNQSAKQNLEQYESWLAATIDHNSAQSRAQGVMARNSADWHMGAESFSDSVPVSSLSGTSSTSVTEQEKIDNANVLRSLHGFLH
ncbi:hypothetical protein [Vibrio nigripulchritudo]|uniref:hypothetical protein n=1 Tax=Vibrio nigripulchritudo TaxID=28173 RepID=UPI00249169A1|nr:hypothetical protein [Vibrio nigripulchritudo]BDU38783.1 hypothetical protein TUMSATVNIG2_32520 [Vibrio nigripulchritudo]BDU44503.1 hypothetical protein TUMSATVNIG3_33010 [Vibrio nigripulchritudo]